VLLWALASPIITYEPVSTSESTQEQSEAEGDGNENGGNETDPLLRVTPTNGTTYGATATATPTNGTTTPKSSSNGAMKSDG
jgi:hypothetical protein